MFRAVASLLLVLLAANARAQDNDPNKWRAFVPYVRELTDCAANAIRANPVAFDLASQDQWEEAIRRAEGCQPELSQMVAAHDQIYGWNTGRTFLQGPYRSDLPRALSVRLRPDFEARTARIRQQEDEQRRQVEAANQARETGQKLLGEAKAAHDACLRAQAVELVPYSNEPADTLVTVILTKCGAHEGRRAELGVVALGLTKQEAQEAMARIMADTRKELLAAIVTIRANVEKGRLERREAPSSRGDVPALGQGKAY